MSALKIECRAIIDESGKVFKYTWENEYKERLEIVPRKKLNTIVVFQDHTGSGEKYLLTLTEALTVAARWSGLSFPCSLLMFKEIVLQTEMQVLANAI